VADSFGMVLGVGGFAQAAHVAGIFEERVLKAGAGSEKGTPLLPGISDRFHSTVGIRVRTGRHAPDSREITQLGRRVRDRGGMEPNAFNAVPGLEAGQPQCFGNGLVRDDSGIVITHESDEQFASHVPKNTSWQFHFRIGSQESVMCGRYRLSRRKQLIAEYFETDNEADWEPRYNIAPSQPRRDHSARSSETAETVHSRSLGPDSVVG